MSKQSNETQDSVQSVFGQNNFDEKENSMFLNFGEDNTIHYRMINDEPVISNNKFGNNQYDFEVLNLDIDKIQTHSITSIRYMRSLEQHFPIEGKKFCVHRSGEGLETTYQVELLK